MLDHDIWVGSSYQENHPKILILGESDYGDTPPLKDYIPQWLGGEPRDPTFARISNAFAGSIPRPQFWSQIAFYNFVPGKVGEKRVHRPTIAAYVGAKPILNEVLSLLKPDGVLILGIEQSEYSQPVVQKFGVAHVVSPHPASYGLKNERLTTAWDDLIHMLEARG